MKKNVWKVVLVAFMVLAMMFSTLACGTATKPAAESGGTQAVQQSSAVAEKDTKGTKAKGNSEFTIVFIPKLVHEWYNVVLDGANKAVKELAAEGKKVNIIWSAPTAADSAQQTEKLEAAIAQKPDAIAIAVIDGKMCKPIMEKAKSQGIKVIAFDTDFEGSPAEAFVGCSLEAQKKSGEMGADLLVKLIGKDSGKIAMLTGSPDAENHKLFSGGFADRMAKAYPNFKIVTKQADNDDKEKATSLTESILAQYPDIDGIFGGDGSAGLGAAIAVEAAVQAGHIKAGQVKIVQYALMDESKKMMKEGYIQGLVDYPPYWIGYYTTMIASANKFDGKKLQNIILPFGIVTKDNVDTYLDEYAAARAKEGLAYWEK